MTGALTSYEDGDKEKNLTVPQSECLQSAKLEQRGRKPDTSERPWRMSFLAQNKFCISDHVFKLLMTVETGIPFRYDLKD